MANGCQEFNKGFPCADLLEHSRLGLCSKGRISNVHSIISVVCVGLLGMERVMYALDDSKTMHAVACAYVAILWLSAMVKIRMHVF